MIGNQYQYQSAHMHFCVLLNKRIQAAYFFDSTIDNWINHDIYIYFKFKSQYFGFS